MMAFEFLGQCLLGTLELTDREDFGVISREIPVYVSIGKSVSIISAPFFRRIEDELEQDY